MLQRSGIFKFVALMFINASMIGNLIIFAEPLDNDDKVTALMRAVRDGDDAAFKKELNRAQDINAQDTYGWTALTYAVARGEEEVMKSLLSKQADVNIVDEDGRSILMYAIEYNHKSIARLLIKSNADLNRIDKNGATAMQLAWTKSHDDIVVLLKEAGVAELKLEEKRANLLYSAVRTNGPTLLQDGMMPEKLLPVLGYGRCRLKMRVLVGADGAVQKVRVLIGLPNGLTDKLAANEYKTRYRPAIKDGQPVAAWTIRELSTDLPSKSR